MAKKTKAQMLETLRSMVRLALRMRSDGAGYAQMARANGAIEGYMRVLLESGLAEARELLELVSAERTLAGGPAFADVGSETLGMLAA